MHRRRKDHRPGWPVKGAVGVAAATLLAGWAVGQAGGAAAANVAAASVAALLAYALLRFAHGRAEAGEHMRQVAESCIGVEACFSPAGRLEWISPSIAALTGYSAQTCLAVPDVLALLVDEVDLSHVRERAARARRGEADSNYEVRFRRNDGETVWVACHWRPVYDAGGKVVMVRVSAESIQARKRTEMKLLETVAELRRAQGLSEQYLARSQDERMRLHALLDVLDAGILFVDADRRVQYVNAAMLRIWQLDDEASLQGMRDVRLLESVLPLIEDAASYKAHALGILGRRGQAAAFEFAFKDGRIIREVSAMVASGRAGHSLGRVWIFEDVTEARRASAALVRLAERDPLTNLYNRRRFHEALDVAIAAADRTHTEVGLMMFDLDGFKPVNDAFGHQTGDAILVEVAGAVRQVVRRNELVFRIGGDEFAILVPDASHVALCELAQRVVAEVRSVGCDGFSISASVGFACFPGDGRSGEALMAAADAAMYRAKSAGKNGWQGCVGSDCDGAPDA